MTPDATAAGVRPQFMYRIFFPFLRFVLTPWYRRKAFGTENIPPHGPLIMAGNHTQNSDPFMIAFSLTTARPIAFMAKAEMFVNPVSGWFFRSVHQFPVNRGTADRNAIRHSLDILARGGTLGIFPQGTRSEAGEVTQVQSGAAFLALQAGSSVVPVGVSRRRVPGVLRHQLVTVVYGSPIDPADVAELPKKERIAALTERIVSGINEALAEADRIGEQR